MTKPRDILGDIVKNLVDNGTLDNIVVAVLEESLESAFEDLDRLHKLKYFEAYQWQDYVDNLQFANACILVLRHFSINHYEAEQVTANKYSLLLEGPF